MILLIYFLAFLATYVAYAYKKYCDAVGRAKHIPGQPLVPFFGNALSYVNKTSVEITEIQMKNGYQFGDFSRVFLGSQLNIFMGNPKDVEVLLSSQTLIDKSEEYDFAREWFGDGLIFSTGNKWFSRRRLITPAFHFKILDEFVEIFDRNSKVLMQQFSKHVGKSVDVYPLITLCALDVICESSMGVNINAQVNSNSPYINAIRELAYMMNQRSVNILYRNPTIFHLTPMGRRWRKLVKITHNFTDQVIKERRQELAKNKKVIEVEAATDDVGVKKKMALLDILLKSNVGGKPLSDADIREEVDTFVFAGHDTTTSAMTFCCYTIAKHPEVQQKVFDEIRNVIGDDKNQPITLQDLNNLHYLELVIKETLRMFPPVAAYGRKIKEDVEINGKLIPKNATVVIAPNAMGRCEGLWKDPNKFIPERFEKDNMQGMHAYSNVVFSAGARNCIGQKFAMLEIKSTISKLLRHYEISVAPGYELRLYLELILKSEGGVIVHLKERQYK